MTATAPAMAFCYDCGERLDLCACRHGAALVRARRERSPLLAALLSLLLPGLGQLYNGEPAKALFFLLASIFLIPWVIAVIEAYYAARMANLEDRFRFVEHV
jgi:TM2 domain-containing membrane protein YozV